ncbi:MULTISPECIES: aminoacyl-tRNA hydrolase [unclassified Enterococcus]|uniref:aminoacyl-tRNA hydrolase n=1 Tax=unclassified Enterococcus TaxID=2608891 RepID=UPI0015560007|nr:MULTISPECIES: aminoacyl-tRNA hydrolase [unclassified Enterococcus]MBS7578272.1 aminoacyl-tRNA hydrolase [Enterococcus sp. MMGLQ5-2]MBS7585452.1 aminoacyl-tRNA hydrolase [Enterococcus sp. MMGLQ5-1]NPD13309.1 aminoacyl-tRNA hydrolase [Enterococcus sp. MMGLQ5-1]NPD38103.1 aminoacyl-tRNA hydrolase [Enterococcus sp. MMGLQ5-2]
MTIMIVGLGNPGDKYQDTKHNIGFMVVDEIARGEGLTFKRDKAFQADVASYFKNGEKVYLIKPTTFMNASGKAVGGLLTYFNIPKEKLLVIYDDLDSEVGRLRLRQKGSAGGHNGIKDIIAAIGTNEFARIKIGIGRPEHSKEKVVNYVLSGFAKNDHALVQTAVSKAASAAEDYTKQDEFTNLMNKYNG